MSLMFMVFARRFAQMGMLEGINVLHVGLAIVGCSASIAAAYKLGLNKPWPLSIVLAAIQTLMIYEVTPFAGHLGDLDYVVWVGMWVQLSLITYFSPFLSVWDKC